MSNVLLHTPLGWLVNHSFFYGASSDGSDFEGEVIDEKVVALVGPIGSEKALFVHQVTHNPLGWASALSDPTLLITAITVDLRGVRVTILDTPEIGSFVGGNEITIDYVYHLVRSWCMRYRRIRFLAGILYFQNMDARQPVLPDFRCFSGLCVPNYLYSSIVLVATGWNRITGAWLAKLAEYEHGWWRDVIHRGARMFPYRNPDLALEAIALLTHACMTR
ncbi:hypothetical protein F5141DRAFT_600035 [Pisolithus sp. B1]|nr:hypothetical protein F5141DRAFT_600035 [Pisolithus sp. B1]